MTKPSHSLPTGEGCVILVMSTKETMAYSVIYEGDDGDYTLYKGESFIQAARVYLTDKTDATPYQTAFCVSLYHDDKRMDYFYGE